MLASGWDLIYIMGLAALRSNQSLEPTAGRCDASLHVMKIPPLQAVLALASGGSAPSR